MNRRSTRIWAVLGCALMSVSGMWVGYSQFASAGPGDCDALLQQGDQLVANAYAKFLDAKTVEQEAQTLYQQIVTFVPTTPAQISYHPQAKIDAFAHVQAAIAANSALESVYFSVFTIFNTQVSTLLAGDPNCSAATLAQLQTYVTQMQNLVNSGPPAGVAASFSTLTHERDELKKIWYKLNPVELIIPNAVGARVDERLVNRMEAGAAAFVKSNAEAAIIAIPHVDKVRGAKINGFNPSVDFDFGAGSGTSAGTLKARLTAPPSKFELRLDPLGDIGSECTVYIDISAISIDLTFNLKAFVADGALEIELANVTAASMSLTRAGSSGICWVASVLDKLMNKMSTVLSGTSDGYLAVQGGASGFTLKMVPTVVSEAQLNGLLGLTGSDPIETSLNAAVSSAIQGVLPPDTTGQAALSSISADELGLKVKFDLKLTGAVSPSVPPTPSLDAALNDRNIGGVGFGTGFSVSVFIDPNALKEAFGIPFAPATLFAPIMPPVSIPAPFSMTGTWATGSSPNAGPFVRAYLVFP